MLAVLDQLQLTQLVSSIPGVSAIGAAAVLAETGDLVRFTSARALVNHAGLCPRDNSSGEHKGRARLSGRGRPELRTAAWRAAWGAQHTNPVLAARYAHLTGPEPPGRRTGPARRRAGGKLGQRSLIGTVGCRRHAGVIGLCQVDGMARSGSACEAVLKRTE